MKTCIERIAEGANSKSVFYATDVRDYINVYNLQCGDRFIWINRQRMLSWARRGFFDLNEEPHGHRRMFMSFDGVVTARAITFMTMNNVNIALINDVHDFLRELLGMRYPFTFEVIWEDKEGAMFGKLKDAMPDRGSLIFEDGFSSKWDVFPDVRIDPLRQQGAPCIRGTRIPTKAVAAMHDAGDGIEQISNWYGISTAQVSNALEWERSLKRVVDRRRAFQAVRKNDAARR